tara:strand:+ start:2167 stop:2565 length:399 start_codon:yes stop_codon:yes gene_type:complete
MAKIKKKITLLDIKAALRDAKFRDLLPQQDTELQRMLTEYNQNRSCPCNRDLYGKILKEHKDALFKYFPGREPSNEEEEIRKLAENHWTVINCHVDELEKKLKRLPPGRKQIAVTRFEDVVTVVVNELDILY